MPERAVLAEARLLPVGREGPLGRDRRADRAGLGRPWIRADRSRASHQARLRGDVHRRVLRSRVGEPRAAHDRGARRRVRADHHPGARRAAQHAGRPHAARQAVAVRAFRAGAAAQGLAGRELAGDARPAGRGRDRQKHIPQPAALVHPRRDDRHHLLVERGDLRPRIALRQVDQRLAGGEGQAWDRAARHAVDDHRRREGPGAQEESGRGQCDLEDSDRGRHQRPRQVGRCAAPPPPRALRGSRSQPIRTCPPSRRASQIRAER